MSKRKISISVRDPAVYKYLREKAQRDNISAYVCGLIRNDMINNHEDLDERIEAVVRRLLGNPNGITLQSRDHPKKDSLSDEDRELLKSLF
ncbi:hypothetical protein [Alicyclobacillus acidoterrestris]|uniref:Uncharacterized protein n=1 Tax=Alicyclobacillus acidoterrestris (strain ATCC 49025 / DSM 3922 / CIP 106132 / NCIMB 13137 / GD3B) TaxID=1356854 RepID=T0DQ62_ALIAG|nr:hypothetical protein [Alicyclobacillus acidoterrestris]EPZ51621.1 hypothetical protein N007_20850 [Alicyclobacillus acidoterrestris ATCC 49025]UNO49369.1 hypothetical protein K1I37_02090 [Alicyclobacillus acidoterrestris]